MLADTGGTDVELIGQQGMGTGRAGQGLEMHWMEVTLAVTNRCSSFPVVSRRPCHAVPARPALRPMQPVGCTALQRTHMQVNGRKRSIAAGEWMDGPASAWELHRSHIGCVRNLLRSGPADWLAVWHLLGTPFGTTKPKKGG